MQTAAEITIALLPIVLFLVFMRVMDSFQLVKIHQVLLAILVGFAVAFLAIILNSSLLSLMNISTVSFSRFVAPVSEEVLKFLYVIYLIRSSKIGFMVDAAILGFAVGAGFAIIENIYYLGVLTEAGLLTWFVRGFGTALMHGGATAIAAIISKDISDRKEWPLPLIFLPGLMAAILLHALFNMFILPPTTSTLFIILVLPPVFYAVFKKSEQNTRIWLGTGLDSDMEMLRILNAGNISETKIGRYIKTIQENFPPFVVGDIICYLRVYLELSIKAKGILILKESGIEIPPGPEMKAQFKELEYLEKQIGKTGKLAIQPLLKINNTDLWQLSMMRV
jgi:protease PrsW